MKLQKEKLKNKQSGFDAEKSVSRPLSLWKGGEEVSILEEMWYGNVFPNEQRGYRSEECNDLLELLQRNCDKLEATLNAEEKETLQKAKDCWEELIRYAECDAFVIGFRLGAQILVAAIADDGQAAI